MAGMSTVFGSTLTFPTFVFFFFFNFFPAYVLPVQVRGNPKCREKEM